MARMRSLKPEFWADEDLAAVSRDARLMYTGLWNLADEHSRLRGDPRYIKGQLFAYDDDLSAADVERLVEQLVLIGSVVRYRVGGSRYLFLPKLAKHQRLEPDKTPSRLPAPEDADPEPDPPSGNFPEKSAQSAEKSAQKRTVDSRLWEHRPDQEESFAANNSEKIPDESALARPRLLSMEHVAGSREHVPPSAGALALVPSEPASPPQTSRELIAEWIEHCRKRPPAPVIGQVGKQIKAMLAEGIDPGDVRAGLAAWWRKGLHPSTLPSVVNEVMNTASEPARASPTSRTGDIDWDAAMARAQAREATR